MKISNLIALGAFILPFTAGAAEPVTPPAPPVVAASATVPPAQELSDLQAQIPVWQARAAIAKLKADIKKSDAADQPPVQATPQGQTAPAMHLISVTAFNGKYGAIIDVDGRGIQVRVGDLLSTGWRVARINDTTVVLMRGRQSRVLSL